MELKGENDHMEEIDDLIRTGSEQEAFSMQEGDWEQLQMMMNEDARQKKIGWIWIASVVLLLLGTWVFLMTSDSRMDRGTLEATTKTKPETIKKEKKKDITKTDLVADSKNTLKDSTKNNGQAMNKEEEFVYSNSSKVIRTEVPENLVKESKQAVDRINVTEPIAQLEETSPLKTRVGIEGKVGLIEESTLNAENVEGEAKEIADVVSQKSVLPDSMKPEVEPELVAEFPDVRPIALDSSVALEKGSNKKLHFYIGAGTEWSVASQRSVGPTKLRLQIGAEYQFLNRWSVLSGVNYAVKDYQTDTEGYAVKPGFWAGGVKPNSISAECNVLEIPLNVRHYFTPQNTRNNSFYLMAGASSYLMASEKYRFTYDVEDPTLKQEWNGKWKSMHYFGVLNLSAGYQKNLKRNCSVLFEPYVSLPLTGIGFGEVDLVSFGVGVQLKF